MPIMSGIALVSSLPRFIAVSIFSPSWRSSCQVRRGDLHPVEDVNVVHGPPVSVGQHASARHLLLVRGDGADLDVGLAGRASERRLQGVTGQSERRRGVAAEGMELAV